MKDIFKIGIITLLLCISAVLFQYLGYGTIDYFIMFLVFLGIGMTIFTFYKSAVKKDYKLFTSIILFVIMFFSFFIYKKNNDRKNYKLMKQLIDVNRTLLDYKNKLGRLHVNYNLSDLSERFKLNFKFVDDYNNNIDLTLREIQETRNFAVGMLSKYQLSNLSTDVIFEMNKYIEDFNQNKEKLEKVIDKYKAERVDIEKRKNEEETNVKNIKQKEEEEKKRKEKEEKEKNENKKKEEESKNNKKTKNTKDNKKVKNKKKK